MPDHPIRHRSSGLLHAPGSCRAALLLTLALLLCVACPSPASARQLAGVHAHLLWPEVDGPARRAQLQQLKDAGADIVRVDVGWSTLEAERKGSYERWYLDRLDQLVDEAEALDIELLLGVVDSPCWASSAPAELKDDCRGEWWSREVQRYAPIRASDYADAFGFLVRRYGRRVRAWEVGNEPNLRHYFRADDAAAAYAELLTAAYDRAKSIDPETFVVGGALASSDTDFVSSLLAHGIAGHFDAFSVHPYSANESPLEPFADEWVSASFVRGVPRVHELLVLAGASAPLWLTEFGWSTCAVRGSVNWWDNCVSEQQQADWIELAYATMASWSYVQAGFVYRSHDDGPEGSPSGNVPDASFGIMSHDGQAKPGFYAFQRAANALRRDDGPAPPPMVVADPTAVAPATAVVPPTAVVPATVAAPSTVVAPSPTKYGPTEVPTSTTEARPPSMAGSPFPASPRSSGRDGLGPPPAPAVVRQSDAAGVPTPRRDVIEHLRLSGRVTRCARACFTHPLVLRFVLAEATKVSVSVEQRRCVRKTCRWVRRGRRVLSGRTGANTLRLAPGVASARLAAGAWRATVSADAAVPARAGFRIGSAARR